MTDANDSTRRYQLLLEARKILYRQWAEKVRVEHRVAEFDKRAPKVINPPTLQRIVRMASEMYAFVCATPTHEPTKPAEPAEPAEPTASL